MKIKYVIILISLFQFYSNAYGQDCNCSVWEVEDNSVSSCDLTVGTVVTVSSNSEFWQALNEANSIGGNMTILFEDGIYALASTASFPYITANDLVIRSLSGNRDAVIITGEGMVPTNSTENGFLIAGSNVTIADLTIREVGNHGIQVSGHNLFVHNVRIQNTYEQMIKGSTSNASIDSAIIQCSLLEYTAGIGPNYYIGGLDIHKGNGWIVRDNVIKNIISPAGSVAEHGIHFWDNSRNNTVERNVIYNCDRGIGFGLGSNGNQNEGGIIRNNMIYNNGEGEFNDVGIGLETSPNTKVYNNSIYIEYPNAIEYRFATTVNVDIINNLTNKAITSRNGGEANLQTNFTSAIPDWFNNVEAADLRINTNDQNVFNAGTDLSEFVADDIDQTLRPYHVEFDIGADEVQFLTTSNFNLNPDLEIWPNPTKNETYIKSNTIFKNGQIDIFDISGSLVKRLDNINGYEIKLYLNSLLPGFYLVKISDSRNAIQTLKVFVSE